MLRCGFCVFTRVGGVEILPMGEEEVKVTESEVPGLTGAWCKREMLRQWSGAIRERSSAWTSSSRAARPRCPSGSASTWPRS
ncbi:hypothetical protein C4B68_24250 [Streptomyces dengpaensis]|uniref:Uncharacterized protein n=1 Tax=Streptomyces dengpaensis TaxID=2049881 RepID=A0ABM6SV34_9ACTN|nr:hypothetical protein C4B68_24250 [Streptomyces dengpaensis]PIB06036.1 hypothetical protein B1C81_25980 [Streptomyces sp. HG99]